MSVEFYYKDKLIGIWPTLDPLSLNLLDEYKGKVKGPDYNKIYFVEDAEEFFDKACSKYYDLTKTWCKSNIIEEILYFIKCSNLDDIRKQFCEIESEIRRKTLIENFNDRIEQLYKMVEYYRKRSVNNDNSFYFKYVKD